MPTDADPTPRWAWDPITLRIVDANAAALAFWTASSRAELSARRFSRRDPMVSALASAVPGEIVLDLAPAGRERSVRGTIQRRGGLTFVRHAPDADAVETDELSDAALRAAFDAAGPVLLLAPDGRLLRASAASVGLLGDGAMFDGLFDEPDAAARLRRAAWRRGAASGALAAANAPASVGAPTAVGAALRVNVVIERLRSADAPQAQVLLATIEAAPRVGSGAPAAVDGPVGWARFDPSDGSFQVRNAAFDAAFPDAASVAEMLVEDDDGPGVDAIWIDGRVVRLATCSPAFGDVLATAAFHDGRAVGELWQAPGPPEDLAGVAPTLRPAPRKAAAQMFSHRLRTHLQTLALAAAVAREATTDASVARDLSLAAIVVEEIETLTADFLADEARGR